MLKWPPSPTAIITYIAVVVSLAAIGSAIATYTANKTNEDRIADIERVQVDTCNGRNTLRTILRVQIQRQIDQSIAFEQSGQYATFFPNIPPDQLHNLLEEQRDDQRADKLKLANEDCSGF